MSDDSAARAARRQHWPIRRYELGSEPDENLSADTTVEERIAMVWRLTLDAWVSGRLPMPTYDRANTPGRILRGARDGHSSAE